MPAGDSIVEGRWLEGHSGAEPIAQTPSVTPELLSGSRIVVHPSGGRHDERERLMLGWVQRRITEAAFVHEVTLPAGAEPSGS